MLEEIEEAYRDDPEIVLAAVAVRGGALQFASAKLQGKTLVVRAAVKRDGLAIRFASEAMKNDKEICNMAVDQNGAALQYMTEQAQNRPTVVMTAVEKDGFALRWASA